MIDSYSFGQMTISGKRYAKDLIILPNAKILSPWWRKSGHRLSLADLDAVVDARPGILVVGKGMPGLMRLESSLASVLAERGIQVKEMSTSKAVKEYNSLVKHESSVAGCFHLTC